MMRRLVISALTLSFLAFMALPVAAAPIDFVFSTGGPDGKMAMASRPDSPGKFEIEAADDFVLTAPTRIMSATFTGLLFAPPGASQPTIGDIGQVVVEIYRVFPKDSDVGRTSGPPTFSTTKVPTRVNSPSDVEFVDRDTASGNLTFSTTNFGTFTASNSVLPGGIHIATSGNGPATGEEVLFEVTFTTPFDLPADHYFFIPQVQLDNGDFLWLSAPRPITSPGTPFPPGFTDLQSWTRDAGLDPDWLRVGTDIVGGSPAPQFNGAFSLSGTTVPLPASLPLLGTGLAGLAVWRRLKRTA
jgi:hypothetical protein